MIVCYYAPRLIIILAIFLLTLPHFVSVSFQLILLDLLLVLPLVDFRPIYSMFSENRARFISCSVLVAISFVDF